MELLNWAQNTVSFATLSAQLWSARFDILQFLTPPTAAMMVVVHAGRPVQRRRIRPIRPRTDPTPQPAPYCPCARHFPTALSTPTKTLNPGDVIFIYPEVFSCTGCRRHLVQSLLSPFLIQTAIPLLQHRLAGCSTPSGTYYCNLRHCQTLRQ